MTKLFGNSLGKQGQRGNTRLMLGVPGLLILPHGTQSCLIDDISASGARVRCDAAMSKDGAGELKFGDVRHFCSIAWVRSGGAGLRFDRRLSLEDMEHFRWIAGHKDEWQAENLTAAARDWTFGIDKRA